MTATARGNLARKYLGKPVRIKTKTGAVFYGKIVKVGNGRLYLKTEAVHNKGSKAHATFAPIILPLVLFDLLAILLLERRPRRRRIRR
ncbi:hypothetical protein DFP94_103205 [Fontibacillus phaseoli]|uniref:Uncharacterized protein n=1 Tax=Fontibacillus phaseoli TaxID=1416533 RepID=A0A369BL97_9BACL|nr:hypothetical protein [Fontibacillus phaseoli]RCX20474.1 hypothetical protein DFP94_103205 [Fontibacillus phaseoli]